MNTIIDFLKDDLKKQPTDGQINVAKQEVDTLNSLFAKQNIQKRHSSQRGIRPQINQVWSVKNEYFDFLGNKQTISHPIFVSLLTDSDNFEEEDFVLVFVISPFIEMGTQQDDICNDASIIGFSFLIENWNEQPILTEILDEYIGYYEVKRNFNEKGKLSPIQKQFREVEIARARFLNNSVSALVEFVELNQNNEFGVVISVSGQTLFGSCLKAEDEFISNEPTVKLPNLKDDISSKLGIIKKTKSVSFKDEQLPFEIQVRKNEDGFVMSFLTDYKIELFDSNNKKISPFSNKEKSVFSTLKKGLYTLNYKNIQEPIKIRLK